MSTLFNWRDPRDVASSAGFFAALQAAVLLFLIAGSHGWLFALPQTPDFHPPSAAEACARADAGKPVNHATAGDYASFYAAGVLANAGLPQAAYDCPQLQQAEERATVPGVDHQYFFNPPTFLLIMQPFARLPYLVSFYLFEAVTVIAWLVLGSRVAGGGRAAVLALLAVPSVWWAMGLGQNSFLSASLMAAGTLALPASPLVAGVAFGALCYKPHLGLMIPVALIAGRQWRAAASAALTVTAAVGLTLFLYGVDTWRGFLAMARQSVGGPIDSGAVRLSARVDPTGAGQLLGLTAGEARLVWLVALLISVACVVWLWRRGGREARSAGLAASVLIAAPFTLFYDLVMASLAAAWLVRAGRRDGFLPGEKLALGLLLLVTLLAAHPIVAKSHVPFGAAAGPVLLGLAVRRGVAEGSVNLM
jgi:hypothetical protein